MTNLTATKSALTMTVLSAISNTKSALPDYWNNTLKQRLMTNGAGSVFCFDEVSDLEKAILEVNDWEEYKHESIVPNCKGYITKQLTGELGIVKIADLPEDIKLSLEDRKGTGNVSAVVSGLDFNRPEESYTVLIIGQDNGIDVVFTLHPGAPIRPSAVKVESVDLNKNYSKQEMLDLGLDYAKIA